MVMNDNIDVFIMYIILFLTIMYGIQQKTAFYFAIS